MEYLSNELWRHARVEKLERKKSSQAFGGRINSIKEILDKNLEYLEKYGNRDEIIRSFKNLEKLEKGPAFEFEK